MALDQPFNNLFKKPAITMPLTLKYFDVNNDIKLSVDALSYRLGASL